MSSILQAQIDFLGEQVDSLPTVDRDTQQIDEAISVALSLFDGIRQRVGQLAPDASVSLVNHWLRSAELILPRLRQSKSHGHRPPQLKQFMHTILEARSFLTPVTADTGSGSTTLDEVERELQGRAE